MNAKNQLEEMSLIDHLTELRKRLLWSFIYIIIIFCACFYFAGDLFYFLAKPLVNLLKVDEGQGFIYTCLLYTSPSPRDQRGSRMPSSA